MRKMDSKTMVMTQSTLRITSFIRVHVYAHKEKECFIAANASEAAFTYPPALMNMAVNGVAWGGQA